MRLKPEEITSIVRRLLQTWVESPHVELLQDASKVKIILESILTKEIQAEENLDEEVEKLLGKYEKEFAKGTLDRRKMFQMAKAQLAKEKGIVL